MEKPQQLLLNLAHRPAYGREDFWVSACNQESVAWIDRWPDWPATGLVIVAAPASGKTHLAQVWQKKTSAVDARSITEAAVCPAAVIFDDADVFLKEAGNERRVLHLINQVREQRGTFLMTAATLPSAWGIQLPDLASRLNALPCVTVAPPDETLMSVVLAKMFSDRQVFVSEDVIRFIVARIERSFASLRDIADKIDRAALSKKKPVTIPFVRELLSE